MTKKLLRRIQIFLASPGDVLDERQLARRVIEDELRYNPHLRDKVALQVESWDRPGAPVGMDARLPPQEAVKQKLTQPKDCDIVIVIFWKRMGTPLPHPEYQKADGSPYLSGTEWEFLNALEDTHDDGLPRLLVYRRTEAPNLNPLDLDFDEQVKQYRLVNQFFTDHFERDGTLVGGYNPYETPADFQHLLRAHLLEEIHNFTLDTESPPADAIIEIEPEEFAPLWTGSPFPGLRAFSEDLAPIFFGRDRETADLIRMVARSRFVAVVGASGSGKSSLVRAGLIPRLKSGALVDQRSAKWLYVTMTPTTAEIKNPFEVLYNVLIEQFPDLRPSALQAAKVKREFLEEMLTHPAGIVDTCQSLLLNLDEDAEVLLFIDQFEELFASAESFQQAFAAMLGAIAGSRRLRVVITVRADFYAQCISLPETGGVPSMAELLQTGNFPLKAPDPVALAEMIEKPASRAGLDFEPGLVHEIVRETGTDPGALALMAYALDELYQERDADNDLTFAAYEAIGRVPRAIARRAEKTFETVDDDAQKALPLVFRELVQVTERGEPTRRRAPYDRVVTSPEAARLVQALVSARLLVMDEANGEQVIDIAHEALLREWDTLADWIHEQQDDFWQLRQVRAAAAEWNTNKRRGDYLWSYERMKPVYRAVERLGIELEPEVQAFIRPETERVLDQFADPNAKDHQKHSMLDRLFEIGVDAVPTLMEALDFMGYEHFDRVKLVLLKHENAALPYLVEHITRESLSNENVITLANLLGHHMVIPVLRARLGDERWEIRGAVVEALMQLEDREGVPLLRERLDDENESVRQAAVRALTQLADWEDVPILRAWLNDTHWVVRQVAIMALAKLRDYESIPLLRGYLTGEHWEVRHAAEVALERLSGGKRTRLLHVQADDEHWEVRRAAVAALGQLGDHESIPLVRRRVDDEHWEVRRIAVEVLGQLGDQESTPLLRVRVDDERWEVRRVAVAALGQLGDHESIPLVRRRAEDEHWEVRRAAVAALGQLGDHESIPLLRARVNDEDQDIRRAAVAALGQLGDQESIPLLRAQLDDGRWLVRRDAVKALGQLGGEESILLLRARLEDEHPGIQHAAVEALGQLGDQESIPLLRARLEDELWEIRQAAVVALGQMVDYESISVIEQKLLPWIELLSDVCLTAANVLVKLQDTDAVPTLVDRLRDYRDDVREGLIELLSEELPAEDVIPALEPILTESPYPRARNAARQILRNIGTPEALAVLGEDD